MGFIANLAVRHQLKKHGYKALHSSVPLSQVRRAVILFDAEDAEFDECRKIAGDFFARSGIELKEFFIDMGRHDKGEEIPTGVATTILKRDLAFRGTLPKKTAEELKTVHAELFICLATACSPAVRCFAGIIPATFCIGRRDWEGSPFCMTFNAPEHGGDVRIGFHDSANCLRGILEYLPMVR